MRLTHLGHACLLVETDGAGLLIDPGAWMIKGLRAARLAWDVKVPSGDVIAAKKRASSTAHFYEET